MSKEKQGNPGPHPDRVKIDQDWKEAMKKALQKERPKDGEWPKPDKEQEKRK